MKKSELTEEFIKDYWLKKYHNTTCAEIVKKYPEFCKNIDWYNKYPVTQEQHDEWYNWTIAIISKTFKLSKTHARRGFAFDYLNCAPNIIDEKINKTVT